MKTFTLSVVVALLFTFSSFSQTHELWGLASTGGMYGGGTIYKMDPDGNNYSVMHNFQAPAGWLPVGKLLMAWDGNFYGACYEGGSWASCTIFRFNVQTQQYEDIWDFDIINGDFPRSGLLEGPGGVLYGVVAFGGLNGSGVIYSYDITTDTYTNLYNFGGSFSTGAWALPVLVNSDLLYGTTIGSGTANNGLLWKYNITTNQFTNMKSFDAATTGKDAYGSLIQATDGKLYGMCKSGGTNNMGTIYSYDLTTNTLTNLHNFDVTNGGMPMGALFEHSPGVLYGMTQFGGVNNYGTIFKYNIITGSYQKLHDFDETNGSYPTGNLSADPVSGFLTGVTDEGGSNGAGVYFIYDQASNVFTKYYDFDGTTGSNPTGGVVNFLPTGIINNYNELSLILYPNPANKYLNIHFSGEEKHGATFYVKNILGKEIMQWDEENLTGNYNKSISLEKLCAGMYVLQLSGTDFNSTKLFVKY